MRITVFGASGKVGKLVVEQLLRDGHTVVAFVHRSSPFSPQPHLKILQGDIYDGSSVSAAIQNSDAVISTLGSWGTARKDILESAMENIIPAMQQASIKRIISLTGADARAAGDSLSPIHRVSHMLISRFAGKVLRDGEQHIALLAASKLDWTVVRSPIMTKSGGAGFTLSSKRPLPWAIINRQAVVSAINGQLSSDEFINQSPYIRKK